MKVGRGLLRAGAVAALAAGLVGCSTRTTTPELSLGAQGVYGASAVTVGFVVGSADTGITYRAELGRRDGNDYSTVWAAELPRPVGTAGTIELGTIVDGSYRLEVGAEQRRGLGSYELSFLSRVAYFLVDTAAPADPEASPDSGSFDASFLLFLSHPELLDPAGSAVAIYVTLDGSIPTVSSTPYEVGLPLEIASSTQVKAVAVDEAGNSSAVVSWTYAFPSLVVTAVFPAAGDVSADASIVLDVYGTGFVVGGSAAAVRDADGTTATQLGATVLSSTHIALWVNLTTGTGGTGGMNAGAGQLVVTNPDASTATIAFVLGP